MQKTVKQIREEYKEYYQTKEKVSENILEDLKAIEDLNASVHINKNVIKLVDNILQQLEVDYINSTQGLECDHKGIDGESLFEYDGHDSHKDYYKCSKCGKTESC